MELNLYCAGSGSKYRDRRLNYKIMLRLGKVAPYWGVHKIMLRVGKAAPYWGVNKIILKPLRKKKNFKP